MNITANILCKVICRLERNILFNKWHKQLEGWRLHKWLQAGKGGQEAISEGASLPYLVASVRLTYCQYSARMVSNSSASALHSCQMENRRQPRNILAF